MWYKHRLFLLLYFPPHHQCKFWTCFEELTETQGIKSGLKCSSYPFNFTTISPFSWPGMFCICIICLHNYFTESWCNNFKSIFPMGKTQHLEGIYTELLSILNWICNQGSDLAGFPISGLRTTRHRSHSYCHNNKSHLYIKGRAQGQVEKVLEQHGLKKDVPAHDKTGWTKYL